MAKTPSLIWAQRVEKVFVTFECIGTENVNVTLSDGLLCLDATAKGVTYKLENLPLWTEIIPDESKWFKNDRCARLHAPRRLSAPARQASPDRVHPCDARRAARW